VPDFRPPLQNPLVNLLANLFLPFALWWGYYDDIEVDADSQRRLSQLRGKRAIFCPNHSKGHDPGIIYSLREFVQAEFRFPAAREIFDRWHGLLGWLIQRIGAYSVERAVPDRQAILITVHLLLEGKYQLVVFPEGRVSNRNDCLLPIERGLTRLFLATAATLEAAEPGEALYVVPVGLRYHYVQDISLHLSNALSRIELTLGIKEHWASLHSRFQRACRLTLERIKEQHDQPLPALPKQERDKQQPVLARTLTSFCGTDQSMETLAWGIDLVERLLYSRVTQKGHRKVSVHIGQPIDVSSYLSLYQYNRRQAAELLACRMEQCLSDLLDIPSTMPAELRSA
jgi:1-acyl-sn-glycerol-3-phosphate acyltransferase